MKRRNFIKTTVFGTAGFSLMGSFPASALGALSEERLTILHTNDMHSRIDPFPQDGGPYAGLGGMARRSELIRQIRESQENLLLLDAGDIFQGTPYFNLFGGELEFRLMSQMGYDAATLGNHDFDNGIKGLEKQLPHAQFPFINSNYDFNGTSLANRFVPYRTIQKGEILTGIFGLGIQLQGLVNEKLYGGIKYMDPVPVAREMVQQLRHQGCHLVICLSHLGYQYEGDQISDVSLARQVSGLDLIIGGHTHTFLDEPMMVQNPNGDAVTINQVGFGGINLGRIDLTIAKGSTKFLAKSKTVKVRN